LTRVSAGPAVAVTEALDGSDTGAGTPIGGVAVAVAVFDTEPASTSACVTEYVAEQVVESPGANGPVGQLATGAVPVPENAVSLIVGSDTVTLPVFVTKNE